MHSSNASDHRGGIRHETLLPRHRGEDQDSGWMTGYLDIMTLLVVLMVVLLTLAPQGRSGEEAADLASRVPFTIPLPSEMVEALPGEPAPRVTSGRLSTVAITAAMGVAGPPRRHESSRLPAFPSPPTPLALLAERTPPPWRVPQPLLTRYGGKHAAAPPLANFVLVLTDHPPAAVSELDPVAVAGAEALSRALDEQLEEAPYFADLEGVEVSRVTEGIMLRVEDRWLFPTATADLTEGGEALIQRLVEVIQRHAGEVAVEGHTDSRSIETDEFPSNWVLSSARAIAVVHALERAGVDSQRLRAVGLADTRPLASNDSAEERAQNRRVEVIIRAQ